MEKIRLDRFLANQANLSRSDAKSAIRHGTVTVNDTVIRDGGILVLSTDIIKLNGKQIEYKKYIYLLLNKPSGVLTASTDAHRQTVLDLIDPVHRRNDLAPVGRLDRDTTGLLLLTDDGDFAHRVISPKSGIPKRYLATLDGAVTDEMVKKFQKGVILADGTLCRPAVLEPFDGNRAYLTLTEGKYHEVKRMFGTVGLGVCALHRESVGNLKIPKDLTPGKYLEMSSEEVQNIFLW